jgi:hypothetical protein
VSTALLYRARRRVHGLYVRHRGPVGKQRRAFPVASHTQGCFGATEGVEAFLQAARPLARASGSGWRDQGRLHGDALARMTAVTWPSAAPNSGGRRANSQPARGDSMIAARELLRGRGAHRGNRSRQGAITRRLRYNVGVDRHAVALRREAYAHQHASRRNAAARPRRTTC